MTDAAGRRPSWSRPIRHRGETGDRPVPGRRAEPGPRRAAPAAPRAPRPGAGGRARAAPGARGARAAAGGRVIGSVSVRHDPMDASRRSSSASRSTRSCCPWPRTGSRAGCTRTSRTGCSTAASRSSAPPPRRVADGSGRAQTRDPAKKFPVTVIDATDMGKGCSGPSQEVPLSSNLSSAAAAGTTIRSLIPARIDRLNWAPFHTRMVLALGTAWVLDGIEITIAGAVAAVLTEKATPGPQHDPGRRHRHRLPARRGLRRAVLRAPVRQARPQEPVRRHPGRLPARQRAHRLTWGNSALALVFLYLHPVHRRCRHRRRVRRDQLRDRRDDAGQVPRPGRHRASTAPTGSAPSSAR